MAKNFKIGIVVGSAVGNALAGLGSVSSSLKILTSNTMDAQSKIQALEKNNRELGGNLVKEFAKVGAAVGAVAYPAIRMESAMAEVNKVVDFEDENGLDRLKNSLLEMSREIPMAANQLAEITASGGRLGVAEKDLLSYTETVAKIGIAFDMTAAEAGQLMAELSNVYKIPINELDVLGDVINYLSNSFATTPQAVATAMKSFAGGAQSFGLTEKHAVAIATALTSLGISGDVAGTSMRNMFQVLNTPEKQSTAFKKAFSDMGFTIAEFKRAATIDAESAFLDLFDRLGEMPREMRAGLSFDLFGGANADLANQLGSNFSDTLGRSFDMINNQEVDGTSSYLGSMEEEYLKMKATTANNLISLKNTIEEFAIIIGDKLLPPINDAVNAFRPIIVSTIEWAQANPELVKTGLKAAGMFFGLKLGVLAFNFAIGSLLASTVKFFQNLKAFISGIKVVTMFLMANPIIAIIAGIAIATTLIYVYWEPIKEFFIGIWNTITTAFDGGIGEVSKLILNWSPLGLFYKAFAAVLGWFGIKLPSDFTEFGSDVLTGFLNGLTSVWSAITGFFGGLWDEITVAFDGGILGIAALIVNWSPLELFYQAFSEVFSWFDVELPATFLEFGVNIMNGLTDGIKSMIGSVKDAVVNVGSSITGWFADKLGIQSPSRVFIGHGSDITAGAAIGITRGLPGARKAIDALSDEMTIKPQPYQSLRGNFEKANADMLQLGGGQSSSPITIHFSPQITVESGSKDGIQEALKLSAKELEKMLDKLLRDRVRRAY